MGIIDQAAVAEINARLERLLDVLTANEVITEDDRAEVLFGGD